MEEIRVYNLKLLDTHRRENVLGNLAHRFELAYAFPNGGAWIDKQSETVIIHVNDGLMIQGDGSHLNFITQHLGLSENDPFNRIIMP